MRPILDKIVVRPIKEKTNSIIEIPEDHDTPPQKGEIVAVGPGTKEEEMLPIPGDIVLYRFMAGSSVTIKGEDLLIMKQADLLIIE